MLNGEVIDEGFRTPELAAKEIRKLEQSRTVHDRIVKATARPKKTATEAAG